MFETGPEAAGAGAGVDRAAPRVSREGAVNAALLALLPLAALLAAALDEPFYVNLASQIAILALGASGLNLALGQGGLVSFGHAAYFGLGGYAVGVGAHHAFTGAPILSLSFLSSTIEIGGATSMPLLWTAAVLLASLAALGIGALSLRTSGVYFIMITLAFAQMVYYLAVAIPTYGGEDGLPIYVRSTFPGLDTYDPLQFFALAFAALALALWVSHRIAIGRFGAALAMARLNETRLASVGVEPFPIKLAALVVSAALTGLAGALYADWNGFVGPSSLSWRLSGELLVMVILGGVGRLCGPLAGAVLFVMLETTLGGWTDRWMLFLGAILLGVVLFARGGLIGALAGPARHD